MARKVKRARPSGANRQPKRASKSRTSPIIRGRAGRVYTPSRSKGTQRSSSKAFAVLARMRRTGESLKIASRSKFTYPAYVLKHLKAIARREGQPNPFRKISGEWVASSSDKLLRKRSLFTKEGYVSIVVKGSTKSLELSRYNGIIERLVNPEKWAKLLGVSRDEVYNQALADLKEFRGKRIAGESYLTNVNTILRLGKDGIIDFKELGSDQVMRGGVR